MNPNYYSLIKRTLKCSDGQAAEIVYQARRNYIVNLVTLMEYHLRERAICTDSEDLLEGDFLFKILMTPIRVGDKESNDAMYQLHSFRNAIIHDGEEVEISLGQMETFDDLVNNVIREK